MVEGKSGATRLDGLIGLLQNGTNTSVRKMAAQQLGELVAAHPAEVRPVLRRIRRLLRASVWETRIAAGQAISAIASQTPKYVPKRAVVKKEGAGRRESPCLVFEKLDIVTVLGRGTLLFGSSGEEYRGPRLDIALQRARLKADLGLDDNLGDLLEVKDEDLDVTPAVAKMEIEQNAIVKRKSADEIFAEMSGKDYSRLSARERNRLRRQAKKRAREGGSTLTQNGNLSEFDRPAKRPCHGPDSSAGESADAVTGPSDFPDDDFDLVDDEEEGWEFEPTCEYLKHFLLEQRWEARHGAAVGLREILKHHAASAGRHSPETGVSDAENAQWLEDIACRLLCVLALDRFGDFVGDAVVAPVRETAAMAISVAAKVMSSDRVSPLLQVVLHLLKSGGPSKWEVRHGALLGVRYLLAIRRDLASTLIPMSFQAILHGLADEDDDVRAVAAEALYPVADALVTILPDKIPELVGSLWDALLDLDDISASTGAVLRLLAKLTKIPAPKGYPPMWLDGNAVDLQAADPMDCESSEFKPGRSPDGHVLEELVPRLWPFLRHNSVSVRRAAIGLVEVIFGASSDHHFVLWIRPLCSETLERIFRNIVLESDPEALRTSKKVWSMLLERLGRTEENRLFVCNNAAPLLRHWLIVASHETRGEAAAYEKTRSVAATTRARRKNQSAKRAAAAARRAAKLKAVAGSLGGRVGVTDGAAEAAAVEGPHEGVEMQQSAASALGMLARLWHPENTCFVEEIIQALGSPYGTARRVACDVCRLCTTHAGSAAGFFDRVKPYLEKEMRSDETTAQIAEVGLSTGSFFSDTASLINAIRPAIQHSFNVAPTLEIVTRGKQLTKVRDVDGLSKTALDLRPHAIALTTDLWPMWEQHVQEARITKRRSDVVAALRMRVLSSIGFISQKYESVRISLSAAATGALVTAREIPLPKAVGPYIKSLMASLKTTKNPVLQDLAADALARLSVRLVERQSRKPISVLLKNLFKHLTAKVTTSDTSGSNSNSRPAIDDPLWLAQRGASHAIQAMCRHFGKDAFGKLPWLWDYARQGSVVQKESGDVSKIVANTWNDSLIVIRTIIGHIDPYLHEQISTLLPWMIDCACGEDPQASSEAAACLADFVAAVPGKGMQAVVRRLVPLLTGYSEDSARNASVRRGAANAIRAVVNRLGTSVIPYAAFLVVPMMQRMMDDDEAVRKCSAQVFGDLVRLMPLEGSAPDDPEMASSMSAERAEARAFLGQLLGTEPRTHYEMPVKIGGDVSLRKYQQECLDWLAFLNRYGLHGALCDDMGLGKTLMTLCAIVGSFVEAQNAGGGSKSMPSLVLCPSTIVAHWVQECTRFFGHVLVPVVMYCGPPRERYKIRQSPSWERPALIVTSYDIFNNDLEFFNSKRFNYVVLDEGHIIKNPKTRVSQSVRKLSPQHRLVLTGTPIQNSVLELWSIFDFLMPGFLGTERAFRDVYAKPILASRESKCTERDRERGMLAMETLHRQVLPFIMRRVKDDVLSELPPKIMQDYYCDMTPLQVRLYEDFAERAKSSGLGSEDNKKGKKVGKRGAGALQALQYLRRLCSHPRLVLTEKHPEYVSIMAELRGSGGSLHDISVSSKLLGLQSILNECGIGNMECGQETGGHRALIFAQLKPMLDIVESDLFKRYMPEVTYLRLDGSVESSKRQGIVTRFNSDPTIDCLLLTTHVGGLGLNLTGADIVIFLEHDWNPTKDLQAMDRAHRMGQKRTVNVYRLITRGTLEEKILGIQQFKTRIANTVVNRENASLQSMNTDQLLDLFQVDKRSDGLEKAAGGNKSDKSKEKGLKSALQEMGDLWDESQYTEEYDMGEFLSEIS